MELADIANTKQYEKKEKEFWKVEDLTMRTEEKGEARQVESGECGVIEAK